MKKEMSLSSHPFINLEKAWDFWKKWLSKVVSLAQFIKALENVEVGESEVISIADDCQVHVYRRDDMLTVAPYAYKQSYLPGKSPNMLALNGWSLFAPGLARRNEIYDFIDEWGCNDLVKCDEILKFIGDYMDCRASHGDISWPDVDAGALVDFEFTSPKCGKCAFTLEFYVNHEHPDGEKKEIQIYPQAYGEVCFDRGVVIYQEHKED